MQVGLLQIVTFIKQPPSLQVQYMLVDHRNMWKICQGQEIRFKKIKKERKKEKGISRPQRNRHYRPGWIHVRDGKSKRFPRIDSTDEIAWQAERGAESCRAF